MIDETAFEEMISEHGRQWQSAAWRVTGNCNDADDAVQEALSAAWERRGSFRERSDFSTFIYSTVIHKAYDLVRRDASRRAREVEWRPKPPRRNGFLYEAIAKLPELYRTTVIAMLENEMNQGAAAKQLGCSENAVCKRMIKAKQQLTVLLKELDEPVKKAKKSVLAGRFSRSAPTKE